MYLFQYDTITITSEIGTKLALRLFKCPIQIIRGPDDKGGHFSWNSDFIWVRFGLVDSVLIKF